MKNIRVFYLKIFSFLGLKFSIYLNRHVFEMRTKDRKTIRFLSTCAGLFQAGSTIYWSSAQIYWSSSPTRETHCQELCTLMMKPMSGLPKLVQRLANYVVVFGIKVESDWTQS